MYHPEEHQMLLNVFQCFAALLQKSLCKLYIGDEKLRCAILWLCQWNSTSVNGIRSNKATLSYINVNIAMRCLKQFVVVL